MGRVSGSLGHGYEEMEVKSNGRIEIISGEGFMNFSMGTEVWKDYRIMNSGED